ncbi:MAG: hypothetical protein WBX22_20960 [Silvibacterium sp.]|jgi:hypothetical protein
MYFLVGGQDEKSFRGRLEGGEADGRVAGVVVLLLCGRRVVDRQFVLAVAGAEEVQIGILSNG